MISEKRKEKLRKARDDINAELEARGKDRIQAQMVGGKLIIFVDREPLVPGSSTQ